MSYRRFARGVRQMGGFAGGTSRLARPPARLEEPDIRPGGDCDLQYEQSLFSSGSNSLPVPPVEVGNGGVAMAFIAHDSGTPISGPGSPWTEESTITGTGWSWCVWSAPADAVSSFDFTSTAGGLAMMVTTPGAIGVWQQLDSRDTIDATALFLANNQYADPFHATVAVVFAAQPDDPAEDFTLLTYGDGAGQGLEIGIWIFEGDVTSGHDGEWHTTTVDPNERYLAWSLFPYECG